MRKRIFFVFIIGVSLLLGTGIFLREYTKYQKYTGSSLLTGTISTWKSGENFDRNHFVLVNPNDVSDYVEYDFGYVEKAVGVEYINSIFFDGNGFYMLATESFEMKKKKLFYLSPAGIVPIAENLISQNGAISGFIKSENVLFLKLDQNLYEINDRTKSFRKVKDFGMNKVWVYPYKNGVVYQFDNKVRFYSESGDMVLSYLPDDMRFRGWCNIGKSIFVDTSNRETYIMNLETGELTLFSKFSFVNYGNCQNGVLLELMPKGGGGATPLDVDYTWSCLLGNDVFMAFTVSIYNTATGKIQNFYFSNNDVASDWLDLPYDKNRFERIKQEIIENVDK